MDFDLIFWMAIIVIYFILQLRGVSKRQKQQQRKQSQPTAAPPLPSDEAARPQAEQTLEEALREIGAVLGMELPETPKPEPARPPEPPSPTPPPVPARPREFQPIPTRYADAEFERKPTAFGPVESIHRHDEVRPKLPPAPRPRVQPQPTALTRVAATATTANEPLQATIIRKLNSPQAAREAFVLGEVFGPPRALRRLR